MSECFVDYLVVCGLGCEGVSSISGGEAYAGPEVKYKPSLIDRLPHADRAHQLPPQLPTCCLPAGVSIIPAGSSASALDLRALCYPIVLTEGNGTKMYASCLAFYDAVPEEVCAQYPALLGAKATKCLCLVSYWPFFNTYHKILMELHSICFRKGSTRPLVDTINYLLYKVPLPAPGGPQVLLTIENQLICVERPPAGRPLDAELSFRPLVQSLDVETLMCLFEAVLLEKRVLLLASQYSLLTAVAEGICQLLYPLKWQHVYIPVMPYSLVEYMEAPTPYLMGLHSAVALDYLPDGVVVVDLDKNAVVRRDVLPPLVQPEGDRLKAHIRTLLQPSVAQMDAVDGPTPLQASCNMLQGMRWGPAHDAELSRAFTDFFQAVLHGAHAFVRPTSSQRSHQTPFDAAGFLKQRRQQNPGADGDWMLSQFLDTQAFLAYIEDLPPGGPEPLLPDVRAASLLLSDSFNTMPRPLQAEVLSIAPDPAPVLAGNQARFKYDQFPPLSGTRLAQPAASAKSPEKAKASSRPPANPLATRKMSNLSLSPPKPKQGIAKSGKQASLDLVARSTSATTLSCTARDAVLQNMKDSALSFDALHTPDPSSPRSRIQDMRKPWEAELIFKQRAALSGLLRSDPTNPFKPSDLQRMSALLSIQSGGGSWELAHLLAKDIETLRLAESPMPAGEFGALCGMLLAILRHAAAKEDFQTVLMALKAGSCLYTQSPDTGVKLFALSRLATRPLWYNAWLWEGAFSCAVTQAVAEIGSSLAVNLGTTVLQCLESFAGYMAAVGLPRDCAWDQLHPLATQEDRAQLIRAEELHCLHGRLSQLMEVEANRRDVAGPELTAGMDEGRSTGPHAMSAQDRRSERGGLPSCSYRLGPHSCATTVLPLTPPEAMQWQCAHTKAVNALDACAGVAVSTSADGTLRFWRTRKGALRQHSHGTLGHMRPACISLMADGHTCALGSQAGTVAVYDTHTSKLLWKGKGGQKVAVTHLVAGASAAYMMSTGADGVARLWDMRDSKAPAQTLNISQCPISAVDFEGIASPVAFGSRDCTCSAWDLRQGGSALWVGTKHTDWVNVVKMNGSGASGRVITGSQDCSARVWNLGSGACEAVLTGHSSHVTSVETTCFGDQVSVVTGSADGNLRRWELSGSYALQQVVKLHRGDILCLSATDGCLFSGAADNSMIAWDTRPPSMLHQGSAALGTSLGASAGMPATAAASNQPTDALASSSTLGLQQQERQQSQSGQVTRSAWQVTALQHTPAQAVCMAHDAAAGMLISGCSDGQLMAWKYPTSGA